MKPSNRALIVALGVSAFLISMMAPGIAAGVNGYDPYSGYVELNSPYEVDGNTRTYHHFYCNLYSYKGSTGTHFRASTFCYQQLVTEYQYDVGLWMETDRDAENITAIDALETTVKLAGTSNSDTETCNSISGTSATCQADLTACTACATEALSAPGASIENYHVLAFDTAVWEDYLPPDWDPNDYAGPPSYTQGLVACDTSVTNFTERPGYGNKCTPDNATTTNEYTLHLQYYYLYP